MNKRNSILISILVCCMIIASIYGVREVMLRNTYKDLKEYCYSSSGDMVGSSYSKKVSVADNNHAIIEISQSEAWNVDPSVTKYLVDVKVLSDIEEVFTRYHMYRWNNKKFSNIFVADGATMHYSFTFEDKYISFSSQVFPVRYRSRLGEIDEIINKYL